MAERTKGDIAIYRDHPDPVTAESLIYIRAVDREFESEDIACMFGATVGSEQEANAEFLVLAWGAHDQLVTALKAARDRLTFANKHIDCAEEIAAANAALLAAGVTP